MNQVLLPAVPNGFAHRFVLIDDLRMHYVEGGAEGGAETIVLLAGFPESWFAWRKVMPILAERYRVIALDLPGQGDSDKPIDGYDTQCLAGRVHDLISSFSLTHYYLAAHDVGAWVAFPYAMMFGNEVKRLALLDAGIPGVTLPGKLPTGPEQAWRTWHFPFHAIPDLPEALISGKERVYLDWFLRRKAADPSSFGEMDIDEYLRIFTAPGGLRAGLAYYRAVPLSIKQNHALTKKGKLTMPVLALSGDQGSIANMAAPLAPFATNVRGETLTKCGHFLPEEQPGDVARALSRFFDDDAAQVHEVEL